MKDKKKYFLIGGLITLLVIVVIGILIYVNNSKTNYSFSEKSFINSNVNNVIDVSIEGTLPIFSSNGNGVFYDFLNDMEKDTGLTFNVSINGTGAYNFINKNSLGDNDIEFYTDHFVVVSTSDNEISDLSSLKNQAIAVMSEDNQYVTEYLSEYGLNLDGYEHFTDLSDAMGNSIYYAVLPMQKYINEIVYNQYKIVYHIEGLHSHYVLNLSDQNATMSKIFIKAFNKWKSNVNSKINSHFLDLYYTTYNITELDRDRLTSDDLIVGYIDNMPIEGKLNRNFSGITNQYLSMFGDMTGSTYKYIEYKDINSLISALNNKKIDIMYNYFNLNSDNYSKTVSLGNIEYVIVTHQNNMESVSGLSSIKDDTVKMVGETRLYNYINSKNIKTEKYVNYEKLIDSLSEDDIVILEKSVYDYYKNNSFKEFNIKYMSDSNVSNNFLINKDNSILYNLFNFYLSTLGVKGVNNMAITNSVNAASVNVITEFIISNITYIVLLVGAVLFLMFKFNKRVKVTKKIKKEDKMLYLDVMTNLKNRNYLNDNLSYWEENKVYPQAIVVVDLNSISVINDTKGHEEGDKQIQSAASILIKTQRENSEIIRTDGNEFLIYLVGYEENQIVTYVNKLMKEFKNLPYEYGASVGYFMITSESTTIDDAINEAVLKMRENKGE